MNTLPASIEAYLKEAGFSLTEIIALKHLLEEDALTLRQLAAKTGKSTGVLDQAMRKLLEKNIVTKEPINENPKYVLRSLDAITGWMEKDMQTRKTEMQRRYKNFEAFISSVQTGRHRPEMEFFEGLEGLSNAYRKLLDRVPLAPKAKGFFQSTARGEMLHEFPVVCSVEDDPLRDFRVQEFRERRSRGVFARFIIPGTPLGRRFESRDPFEYRQSILVPEEEHPITFEKVIAGDTVGCFNHAEKRACFIRFPEFAESERQAFEREWQARMQKIGTARPEQATSNEQREMDLNPVPNPNPPPPVPVSTRTLSGVREFFLSRTSLAFMGLFAIVAAGLTYSLYRQNVHLNTQRVRERAMSIASTAALQFDPADLEKLRGPEDIRRPEYAKIIYKLNEIRRLNEEVQYIYIMRPTDAPNTFTFIADADPLDPYAKKDLNADRKFDIADWQSAPGEPYDTKRVLSLQRAFSDGIATADEHPTSDQWGTFLSGVAPITHAGKPVALLGIDIPASRVYDFTQDTLQPLLTFLGLFFLFILIRLASFSRSLFLELLEMFKVRRIAFATAAAGGAALFLTAGLFLQNTKLTLERIRERVTSIAATGALQFSAEELSVLNSIDDVRRPEYQNVVRRLNAIRSQNVDIIYVYIIRPTTDQNTFEFVADADAVDPFAKVDTNHDGKIDDADTLGTPGLEYDVSQMNALTSRVYTKPVANSKPYTDKWGSFITGYAPIRDKNGEIVALLSVDMWASKVREYSAKTFAPLYIFFALFVAFILFRSPGFKKSLLHDLFRLLNLRAVSYSLTVCTLIALTITYSLYRYTLKIVKDDIGHRLMSIAATAAPEIDARDLEPLRFARDMKRPEYQRVFQQLNEIRDRNQDVTYVYIFRPTDTEGIWEFVADADSNYFLPENSDINNDQVLNEEDENIAPGVRYDVSVFSRALESEGLLRPTYEKNFVIDQWGTFLTGSAPIVDETGRSIGILGVDTYVDNKLTLIRKKFRPLAWFFLITTLVLVIQAMRNLSRKRIFEIAYKQKK